MLEKLAANRDTIIDANLVFNDTICTIIVNSCEMLRNVLKIKTYEKVLVAELKRRKIDYGDDDDVFQLLIRLSFVDEHKHLWPDIRSILYYAVIWDISLDELRTELYDVGIENTAWLARTVAKDEILEKIDKKFGHDRSGDFSLATALKANMTQQNKLPSQKPIVSRTNGI